MGMTPTFPRDYHKKRIQNDRLNLEEYYSRHDEDEPSALTGFCILAIVAALALVCLGGIRSCVHTQPYQPPGMPATVQEKESMLKHIISTVTAEEIAQYNYYNARGKQ